MRAFRLLAVLLLLAACDDSGGKAPHVGEAPPAFKLATLTDGAMDYPAQLAGKVVVVRFWATWCPFCKEEMKTIQTVWTQHRDKGFEVLAINAGQEKGDIEGFITKLGVTYPVLLDPGSKVTRAYGVTGLPMTLFVGRDGKIKGRILGETDEATFRRKVEELL
ncbi:TlpA family protein disulfide reductase [Paramagnetospirillum kuznetsovii]|uniref:TlpA family protein disulfide reductase n=1 Tax=Paramagnetospirillum kuznetsovii TaxID=2053833 RepID=A0A364NTD3_9PROT|nr:TlpA disulfide reductase family protein [Paramagnetospirillum kuznetsovii]RAU20326.1 TlpA family protein disulfide reductase [Paramagnetospirillum kuznetsovii]